MPANTPTPTPTLSVRSDVVIDSYTTAPDALTPGAAFQLTLSISNVSPLNARQVAISLNLTQTGSGTLAPMTSSNVRYIDALAPGDKTTVTYSLTIDGSAAAGLVPVAFDLSYMDDQNQQYNDTQTISLRIDTDPLFYISFFTSLPSVITVGDTFDLPVQVINIGPDTINVNTIELTSDQLTITNGSTFIGSLDSGTSGAITAQATATMAGTVALTVNVNYLDAFQQPQTYTKDITIDVQGSPTPQPSLSGSSGTAGLGSQTVGQTTVLQRIWRALLGFFGLGVESPTQGGGAVQPGG